MNKRRRMAFTLGGALLIVAIGAAVYALVLDDSETNADAEPGPQSVEYETFTDEENGFRISYPATWTRGTARSGMDDVQFLATPPGTENAVSVSIVNFDEPVTVDARTSPELVAGVEDLLDRTIETMPGVVEVVQRRRVGVQDVQGWTYIYRFEDQTDRVGTQVRHFLFRGDKMYMLIFQAFPERNYAELAEHFDRVLSSFEFIGNANPEPAASVPDLE